MTWQEIPTSEAVDIGTYRYTFSNPAGTLLPAISAGTEWDVLGYTIRVVSWDEQVDGGLVAVFRISKSTSPKVQTITNPQQLLVRYPGGMVNASPELLADLDVVVTPPNANPGLIIGGVLAVLGLGALYLVLTKVEKLVDNPAVDLTLLAVVAIAIIILIRVMRQ